jgi:hypothetical protein
MSWDRGWTALIFEFKQKKHVQQNEQKKITKALRTLPYRKRDDLISAFFEPK